MAFARYDEEWLPLSPQHTRLRQSIDQILEDFANGNKQRYTSHAIIGAFGSGKTQALYYIFRQACGLGLLPMYVHAEVLFSELLEQPQFVPTELAESARQKEEQFLVAACEGAFDEVASVIDPRGVYRDAFPESISIPVEQCRGEGPVATKVVVLVDECEGIYRELVERCKGEGPLREWLQAPRLKFLAFAPMGLYDMHRADLGRINRLVLPAVDVAFVRENYLPDAGQSNAAWWLSRGKPRPLFRAIEVIKSNQDRLDDVAVAVSLIRDQLDPVGQGTTEVPPAEISQVSPERIPSLFSIAPKVTKVEKLPLVIPPNWKIDALASHLTTNYGLRNDIAIAVADNLKSTTATLSDEEGYSYIPLSELVDLLLLALDRLLEHDFDTVKALGGTDSILRLYQELRGEGMATLTAAVVQIFNTGRAARKQLPLQLRTIRSAFPFPTVDPTLDTLPEVSREHWEGQGLPLWTWRDNDTVHYFFVSARDFQSYAEADAFRVHVLGDRKAARCLFASEIDVSHINLGAFERWLTDTGKMEIESLNPLTSDFLLSLADPESIAQIPARLEKHIQQMRNVHASDVIIQRKIDIYNQGVLSDTRALTPAIFCREDAAVLSDAEDTWGTSRMGAADVAISGIALAFADVSDVERQLFADLRELFAGDRRAGPLRELLTQTRRGHATLVDNMLPRKTPNGVEDRPMIRRLSEYWSTNQKSKLHELAQLVPLSDFRRLTENDDLKRVVEAFWRSSRRQFEQVGRLQDLLQVLREADSALQEARALETVLKEDFSLLGLSFDGEQERLLNSYGGFHDLVTSLREVAQREKQLHPLTQHIIASLLSAITLPDMGRLQRNVRAAQSALEQRQNALDTLARNIEEMRRAARFCSIDLGDVTGLDAVLSYSEERPSPTAVATDAMQHVNVIREINGQIIKIEKTLQSIEKLLTRTTALEAIGDDR